MHNANSWWIGWPLTTTLATIFYDQSYLQWIKSDDLVEFPVTGGREYPCMCGYLCCWAVFALALLSTITIWDLCLQCGSPWSKMLL